MEYIDKTSGKSAIERKKFQKDRGSAAVKKK